MNLYNVRRQQNVLIEVRPCLIFQMRPEAHPLIGCESNYLPALQTA